MLLLSAFLASSAKAQFTEIDTSSNCNDTLQNGSFGSNFQLGGTQLIVAGVPFGLAELNNNPATTGTVALGPTGSVGVASFTFSVPAGTHASALYCLANTAWGEAGVNEGSITVTGNGGETATLTLTEGFNIRDENNASWCNTLTDPTVVPTYFQNGAPTTNGYIQSRLDRQKLILPATFSGDTIASITFQGNAQANPNGTAFLAGLTLSNVPEPTSLSLLVLGAVGLLGVLRLRRR